MCASIEEADLRLARRRAESAVQKRKALAEPRQEFALEHRADLRVLREDERAEAVIGEKANPRNTPCLIWSERFIET